MAENLIKQYQTVQYMNVASVTFFVYDCLITFSDEVEFIWCSPWNLGKVLFVGTRYLVFIDSSLMLVYLLDSNLSNELCGGLFIASSYLIGIGVIIAGIIMSIRVYALWEKSRRVLAVLVLSILTAFILVILMCTKVQSELDSFELKGGIFAHCISSSNTLTVGANPVPIIFAVLMSLDCVIALLTAWRGFLQWRYSTYHGTLITIVYQDGLLYFVCLFAFSAANFVNARWEFGGGYYYDLLVEMQRCFHSVISARIILNMRKASKGVEQDFVNTASALFAAPISEENTLELTERSRVSGETSSRSVYQDQEAH